MAAIFLDLDGTLTDPKPGITGAVRHALLTLGLPAPHPDDLTWTIGPPLIDSFRRLGAPDPEEALGLYRAHYNAGGLYDAVVFPGIPASLDMMHAAGHRLYLATAKPHAYARKITAHFGLASYMTAEFGPELDGNRNDKADLLAHALAETGEEAATAVMVGDRRHDVDAARANGMAAIAVAWGYGGADEHRAADLRLHRPEDLGKGVLDFLAARSGHE
jgi:phosphoglycolate phosphatase